MIVGEQVTQSGGFLFPPPSPLLPFFTHETLPLHSEIRCDDETVLAHFVSGFRGRLPTYTVHCRFPFLRGLAQKKSKKTLVTDFRTFFPFYSPFAKLPFVLRSPFRDLAFSSRIVMFPMN